MIKWDVSLGFHFLLVILMTFDHSGKHFDLIQQSHWCKTYQPIITQQFCSILSQLQLSFSIVQTSSFWSLSQQWTSTSYQCFYPQWLLSKAMKYTRDNVQNFRQCLSLIGTRYAKKCRFFPLLWYVVYQNILVFLWRVVRDRKVRNKINMSHIWI